MGERTTTSKLILVCMGITFEERVAIHGEYPILPQAAAMPEGYLKALEAQRVIKSKSET